MSPKHFRYFLIAYLALGIAGGIFDFVFPSAVPEVLSNAQEANDAELSNTSLVVGALLVVVALPIGIASFVGLYLFRPWAPRLAVAVSIGVLFVLPLLGASVASGWSAALGSLSATLWGVILALVYFSPLKERFKGHPLT